MRSYAIFVDCFDESRNLFTFFVEPLNLFRPIPTRQFPIHGWYSFWRPGKRQKVPIDQIPQGILHYNISIEETAAIFINISSFLPQIVVIHQFSKGNSGVVMSLFLPQKTTPEQPHDDDLRHVHNYITSYMYFWRNVWRRCDDRRYKYDTLGTLSWQGCLLHFDWECGCVTKRGCPWRWLVGGFWGSRSRVECVSRSFGLWVCRVIFGLMILIAFCRRSHYFISMLYCHVKIHYRHTKCVSSRFLWSCRL